MRISHAFCHQPHHRTKTLLEDFFATARNLGLSEVEIRNDLPDTVGTVDPAAVKAAAEKAGVTIISINALYPFNVWSGDLPKGQS